MASPELPRDLIGEILLRVAPGEPAHLIRAALVCKLWIRILSDPAFLRRYRRFHRTPPLLGFFHTAYPAGPIARFTPTTAASPFPKPALDCPATQALDCRHGRVLLRQGDDDGCKLRFVVWDPITGVRDELRGPGISYATYSVAVLCAVAGCGHFDCRGGPFRVVFSGYDVAEWVVRACVYSSETRAWGEPASIHLHGGYNFDDKRGALIGDEIYWTLTLGFRILKYDLSKHCLSWIKPPNVFSSGAILIASGDGSLGLAGIGISRFAGVWSSTLYLWSAVVNPEGIEGWVQWKVIELKKLFPIKNLCCRDRVLGFAEGIRVIFVSTSAGVYTLEPMSGQVTKVSEREDYDYNAIVPFMSFFTPDCAGGKLLLPVETH
ncbi:unnamed protein product [Urochloa humidicola]